MDENTYYVYMDELNHMIRNLNDGHDIRTAVIKLADVLKRYLTDEYYDDVS